LKIAKKGCLGGRSSRAAFGQIVGFDVSQLCVLLEVIWPEGQALVFCSMTMGQIILM
jgi:hypothetical protein